LNSLLLHSTAVWLNATVWRRYIFCIIILHRTIRLHDWSKSHQVTLTKTHYCPAGRGSQAKKINIALLPCLLPTRALLRHATTPTPILA